MDPGLRRGDVIWLHTLLGEIRSCAACRAFTSLSTYADPSLRKASTGARERSQAALGPNQSESKLSHSKDAQRVIPGGTGFQPVI
jgi:hypothetical protein